MTPTALITGASAGIGRATALELARLGYRVVVSARRDERLAELVAEIEAGAGAGGGAALALPADASDTAALDRVLADATDWCGGPPDVVVANAGHGLAGGVLSSDRARWEHMIQLNFLATTHLMRVAAQAMAGRDERPGVGRGDVVVLGSCVGVNVSPFSGMYGATKFAVGAAAEALRREVGGHGVRVTNVRPGIVISEFQDVAGYDAENFGKAIEKFGQPLQPDDVARTIGFVVSQPPHVHVNELTIRPVGQDYP